MRAAVLSPSVAVLAEAPDDGHVSLAVLAADMDRPGAVVCRRSRVHARWTAAPGEGPRDAAALAFLVSMIRGASARAPAVSEDEFLDPLAPPPPAAARALRLPPFAKSEIAGRDGGRAAVFNAGWSVCGAAETLIAMGRMDGPDGAAAELLGPAAGGGDVRSELTRLGWGYWRGLESSGLNMDAAAAAMAQCPGDATAAALIWYAAPGEAGRIRRQAAGSMPILAGVIAAAPELRRAVDDRHSLTAGLRALFPALGAGGVKRLGRVISGTAPQERLAAEPFDAAGGRDATGVVRERYTPLAGSWRTAEAIAWLERAAVRTGGVNLVPDSEDEWSSYTHLWSGMIMPLAAVAAGDEDSLLPKPAGGWRQLHASLARDLECGNRLPDRHELNTAVVDAVELSNRLADEILLPVMVSAAAERGHRISTWHYDGNTDARLALRAAARMMLIPPRAKQPLRQVAQSMRAGITRLIRMDSIVDAARSDTTPQQRQQRQEGFADKAWQPPWEDCRVPARAPAAAVPVRFLRSREEMRTEGSEMGHCIGRMRSYWSSCWAGTHVAAHVGGPGEAGASAYYKISAETGALDLMEIRSLRNRPPTPAVRDAAKETARQSRLGGLSANPDYGSYRDWLISPEAAEVQGTRRTAQDDRGGEARRWRAIIDYEPDDKDTLNALWEVWREILPAASGVNSPAAWVWRSPAARDALQVLDPEAYDLMAAAPRRAAPEPRP